MSQGSAEAAQKPAPGLDDFRIDSLHPGLAIDVEIESQLRPPPRCRTTLIGWREHKYLLLRPPENQFDNFFAMNYVILRYLVDGDIFAFKTQILATTFNPEKLIFCRYPQKVTNLRLRQHNRYTTRLYVQLETEQTRCGGLILDISRSGCQFMTSELDTPLDAGSQIGIIFPYLRQGNGSLVVSAIIRNRREQPNGISFGIQFTGSVNAVMKLLMLEQDDL